jgi:drug/metabolite transporter (DMT)-like permease
VRRDLEHYLVRDSSLYRPGGYAPMTAAALRFSLAAVILLPLAWRARPWPRLAQWGWLVLAGALDALGYALIYLGERDVPGGLAAVISGVQPVILTAFLFATGLEVVRPRDVVSALVAFVGIAVIFAEQLEVSRGQALGVVMVLGSVVVTTLYSVVIKRHAQQVHTWMATAIFIAVTAAFLWIAAAASGTGPLPWPPPPRATCALLYLAIAGTAIGFGAYFWLLARVTLVASNLLAFVLPLIALAVDALFETQLRLGAHSYLGIALTLLAVGVSRWPWAVAPARRSSARLSEA